MSENIDQSEIIQLDIIYIFSENALKNIMIIIKFKNIDIEHIIIGVVEFIN